MCSARCVTLVLGVIRLLGNQTYTERLQRFISGCALVQMSVWVHDLMHCSFLHFQSEVDHIALVWFGFVCIAGTTTMSSIYNGKSATCHFQSDARQCAIMA